MVKSFLFIIAGIFTIAVIGTFTLDNFPQLQPLAAELKTIIANIYDKAKGKYGVAGAALLFFGLIVLIGTSSSSKKS